MKHRDRLILLPAILLVSAAVLGGGIAAAEGKEASGIDAHADRIQREMSDYLKTTEHFDRLIAEQGEAAVLIDRPGS